MSQQQRRPSAPELSSVPGFREHLARTDLFSAFPEKIQDDLVKQFHFRHFSAGETIIQSGDKASSMFILLKGDVQVISDKFESVLAQLGPGMIFGEIGAVFGVNRVASVIAKTAGMAAVISRKALKEFIGKDRVLWNHLKGIAFTRYRTHSKPKADSCHLGVAEKEIILAQTDAFKSIPSDVIKSLAELAETRKYHADEIVDFFSPRTRHFLYLITEGTAQLHYLDSTVRAFHKGELFASYDQDIDFVKSICDCTILMLIDVEQGAAVFAEHGDAEVQEAGSHLFNTSELTDHVDANSSITIGLANNDSDLCTIVNPAQFGRRRRNSAPVFNDRGQMNNNSFIGIRSSIPREVSLIPQNMVNDDKDLRQLLLNSDVVVDAAVTLFFEGRLSLTPIKNFLTDARLLAIVSVMGPSIEVLNLTDCHLLTSHGVLAAWIRCPNLIKVSLQGCWNLDDLALSTVSRSACKDTLRELNLSHCFRITAKGLELLGPLQLTRLDLSYCKGIDDRTWPILTQFASTLKSLKLRRCLGITDASVEGAFGVQFNELEYVDLSECPFLTDSSISTLLSVAPNIRSLLIAFNTSVSGTFLIHHSYLPKLKVLDISRMAESVSADFCDRIVKCCPNLERINLNDCTQIDDDTILNLTDSLNNLSELNVDGCALISAGINDLLNLKYK